MSLLDKAKTAASQAAVKAKETARDAKQKVDLDRAYTALGKAAYEAIEAGEVTNEKLEPLAAKIRPLLVHTAADDANNPG